MTDRTTAISCDPIAQRLGVKPLHLCIETTSAHDADRLKLIGVFRPNPTGTVSRAGEL
jgi:hypothetical protein